MAIDYKSAGVDVERGYEAVKLMKKHVKETYNDSVLGDIGSFGGLYALGEGENADVLVAGTDGVGTKLKYAFVLDKHDTVGIDCVAMCVNDIVCQGAKPLIFLDYIALGRLVPGKVAEIVKGVAEGCKMAGCALIGGETAEMPGFYEGDDYDMAGFSVGIAKRNRIITGERIKAGDRLIGLRSSGAHSNGYSLVRKIFEPNRDSLLAYDEELGAIPADVILAPTRIYVKQALSLMENCDVLGMAHITGGGFIENIPRILPEGLAAKIDRSSYELPRLFKVLQHRADISDEKMYNTFNMGVGLVICVTKEEEEKAIAHLKSIGEDPIRLGEVVEGNGVIL